MSAVINTNIAAIRTHGVYSRNNDNMNAAMTRVATAQKVNSPRDNAADWAISEKIRERIRSLNQANQNVQNDTALMKTASGALSNTIDILKTLKERAINSANASNQDTDRERINAEVSELLDQIDTNSKVKFNGKYLLDGSAGEKVISATKSVSYAEVTDTALNTNLSDYYSGTNNDFNFKVSWTKNDGTTGTASNTLASSGKLSSLFTSANTTASSALTIQTVTAADTALNDGSAVTKEDGTTGLKADKVGIYAISKTAGANGGLSSVTIEITGGGSANASETFTFGTSVQKGKDVANTTPLNFQVGDDSDFVITATIGKMDSSALGIGSINLSTVDGAKSAITSIDSAIATALEEQTKLGAYETRLGYTADNLSTQIENLEASDSAIRDADIAKEMTNYMKYSVLAQASQYMMAQAGQNAFSVLNLLQA